MRHLTLRLPLALLAVAFLSALAPVLPTPYLTPTPMAKPNPAKATAKPKPKAKPKKATKPKAMKPRLGPPAPKATPTAPPLTAPKFPPAPAPTFKPSGKAFPAGTPEPGKTSTGSRATSGLRSPPPTPTPGPPAPIAGGVRVGWGGASSRALTLRYGQPLRLRPAPNYHQLIQLLAVDPRGHGPDPDRTPQGFPAKLDHRQMLAYLGTPSAFHHRNWVIARGPQLDLLPEAFLGLSDQLNGPAGYLWPMRFLFYVVVTPPGRERELYYKLVVTVTR